MDHAVSTLNVQDRPARVGAVSFLNTRPLIAGLEGDPGVQLVWDVPSRLATLLAADELDAALVPVVDLLGRSPAWQIVSDACIAAEGETLTVRIFSQVPPDQIHTLHVDGHSHTSVALARLIWDRVHRRPLHMVPLAEGAAVDEHEAVLLIGDKVISADARRFAYDIDLGGAWRAWTGLPFVFAVWASPRPDDFPRLADALAAARDRGVAQAVQIAERDGPTLGWKPQAAIDYLTRKLSFSLTQRFRQGLDLFLQSVGQHAIVSPPNLACAGSP